MQTELINMGFTGPFGDANLGDYGMLVNNVLDLSAHLDELHVFTYDDSFVSRVAQTYFPELSSRAHSILLSDWLLNVVQDGITLTPVEILEGVSNFETIERAVARLEVLVVNGGGYLNELWCQPHRISKMIQILVPILVADDYGIPIVFTGNSYGPFGPRSEFLQAILASLRNVHFYSRDRVGSPAELRKIGVAEEKIDLVPDDLFILNQALLQSEPLQLPDSYVVFETYQPLETLKENKRILARFASSMEERDLSVLLLPMYSGRGGEDQAKWMSKEFGWAQVEFINNYLPLSHAHQVIAGARLVVSDRYHALVLALANGVPVIHALRTVLGDKWYYYRKSLGILDTALRGASFSRTEFMALSPFQALERVVEDFETIEFQQRELYKRTLRWNLTKASESRARMLQKVTETGEHNG